MSGRPMVTVVVPTRNEAADISGCLEHVAAQDYGGDHLEVVVVDGCSDDGTAEVARQVLATMSFARSAVLENPRATTPSNLNAGLEWATGDVICRVDARTRVQPHYVRTCVEVLTSRPEVAVVGGAQVAVVRDPTPLGQGIARALNNRWTMGGSRYRRSTASGVADTVYLGAFRRRDLLEASGWDERLASNQDFDLNRRMTARGVVWFDVSLRSGYLPRTTLHALWAQYHRFGRAKVAYWRTTGTRPEPRQGVLMVAPLVVGLAVAVLLVRAPPAGVVAAALAGIASLLGIEALGADEPSASSAGHLVAALCIVVVGAGWLGGICRELLGAAAALTGSAVGAVPADRGPEC